MKSLTIMGVIAVVLLVFVAIQSFQISAIKNSVSGNVVGSNSGSAAGESNADMMARMHPDQVKKGSSQSSQPTMVGGC